MAFGCIAASAKATGDPIDAYINDVVSRAPKLNAGQQALVASLLGGGA